MIPLESCELVMCLAASGPLDVLCHCHFASPDSNVADNHDENNNGNEY